MIVAEVFFFNMYFVSAQVLFEKMREMIHFLPDPKPSLKVSQILSVINYDWLRNNNY